MSRPDPKRSRSKSGSRLEAVADAIAGLVPKCIATIVELPNGPLILMACPAAAGCTPVHSGRARDWSGGSLIPRRRDRQDDGDQGLPGGGGA
jgi:hypothetical protein